MRPKLTALQRQARFIWRVEHGKRCKTCNWLRRFAEYSRDNRRIDGCMGTCKTCKRVTRTLTRLGLMHRWPEIRLALRLQSVPHNATNLPPER